MSSLHLLAQGTGTTATVHIPAIVWLLYAVVIVFVIAAEWRVFTKAGQPGWAVIIPIYNAIVFLRIAGRPAWWFLLFLIPFVNFVIAIIVLLDIAKRFGKGAGFAIGMIFLPIIFIPILGFGSAQYQAATPAL